MLEISKAKGKKFNDSELRLSQATRKLTLIMSLFNTLNTTITKADSLPTTDMINFNRTSNTSLNLDIFHLR